MSRWRALLLLALCLLGGQSVQAADNISLRARVPLNPIYGWSVQRQSSISLPSVLTAGDSLHITGTLRRTDSVVLINHDVVLLLGRGDEVVASSQDRTDQTGAFNLNIVGDESWRGEMWLSVIVLTYGHPLWLVDRQLISWQAPSLTTNSRVIEGYLLGVVPAVCEGGNTQVSTGQYHATIKPNANIINDVERRVGSVVGDLAARGRDSPVVDRSFGVWRWAVG